VWAAGQLTAGLPGWPDPRTVTSRTHTAPCRPAATVSDMRPEATPHITRQEEPETGATGARVGIVKEDPCVQGRI
jgi:hypothetical protein